MTARFLFKGIFTKVHNLLCLIKNYQISKFLYICSMVLHVGLEIVSAVVVKCSVSLCSSLKVK
jgi:hypothetical protein